MPPTHPLASVLFSKVRREVLGLLWGHPDRGFYLREIVDLTGLGVGHIQRELKQLTDAGILRRSTQGRHVYYQADPACPVFDELRGIVRKTLGAAGLLREALASARIPAVVAFVYGSVARGDDKQSSDLDLIVIGDATLRHVADAVRSIERKVSREINPTVYPPREFRSKLEAGNHFLKTVMKGEKVFVVGGPRELRALLEERLDPQARDVARRDRQPLHDRRP
jgi:predicted nucleotidyltransferase